MSLFASTGAEWRVLVVMDVKVIKFYYDMIKFFTNQDSIHKIIYNIHCRSL